MAFSGAYQIYTIVTSELVNRVADWGKLATSINSALSGLAQSITDLGPAWGPTRNVPATQNLDVFKVPGMHRITTPDTATITNLPPGMRSAGVFENLISSTGDSWWVQRVTEYGWNPRTWWRVSADTSGTFNAWALAGEQSAKITDWHVFLAAGQSNMSGRGSVSTLEGGRYLQPRIYQFGYTRRVLEQATVPLDMHDNASGLSPATTFAQAYLRSQPSNVGVLIIPAAHGGTGFTTSTTTQTWTPGITTNPLYDLPGAAVAQVNAALSAVATTGASAKLKGVLWHQGEDNSTMSTATYATNLDALIAYFRSQFSNPSLPFVVGQMTPEGIAATTGRSNIDTAHRQTVQRVKFTGFAAARTNGYNSGDTTHMSQDGVDFLGRNYVDALEQAIENEGNPIDWLDETNGRVAQTFNPAANGTQTLYSDTGWRDISALFTTLTSGNVYARRWGATVWLDFQTTVFSNASGTATMLSTGILPSLLRPIRNTVQLLSVNGSTEARRILPTGGGSLTIYNTVAGEAYMGLVSYPAGSIFTGTLPGTAVGGILT